MTTKATAAAMAALILSSPALGDAESDRIRAKLLAAPTWAYEWGQRPGEADPHGAAGKLERGVVQFAEKDGKLVGDIDVGWKCSNEVKLRADGFTLMTCLDVELEYVQAGDEFKATFGSYNYWIKPAR